MKSLKSQKNGEVAISKMIGIILVILVVAAVLFFLFKANIISWIKQIFPDFSIFLGGIN